MTIEGWILILAFTGIIALIARPVGLYLAAVYGGERTWLTPVMRPVETAFYAAAGVKANDEQSWRGYAAALVMFSPRELLVIALAAAFATAVFLLRRRSGNC